MKHDNIYTPLGFIKSIFYLVLYFSFLFFPHFYHSIIKYLPLEFLPDSMTKQLIMLLPLFFIGILFYGRDIRDSWFKYKNYFWRSTLMIITSLIFFLYITNYIMKYFAMNSTLNQDYIMQSLSLSQGPILILSIILLCLMGPLVEEIVFRHIMIGQLSLRIPVWICTIISIAIFVFLHSSNIYEWYVYLPLTLALTAIYLGFNKSIAHSYALHLFNNLLGVFISRL